MVGVSEVFLALLQHYFYQIQITCRIQSVPQFDQPQCFQGLITSHMALSSTLLAKRIAFDSSPRPPSRSFTIALSNA